MSNTQWVIGKKWMERAEDRAQWCWLGETYVQQWRIDNGDDDDDDIFKLCLCKQQGH